MQSHLKLLLTLVVLALAACFSKVGQLPQAPPTAVAATVGQPYTTDSGGVLHTTVRAGSDVILSGVNSQSNATDTGIPIVGWVWKQLNPGSTPVDLIKRTTDNYSFTAPQVTAPTTLTFELTVTNANGAAATTQAQVVVEPVRDSDHFLTYLNTHDTFTVTAASSAVIGPSVQARYSDTVPYTITVTKLVTYTDNDHVQHSRVPVGAATVYNGGWSAQLGSGGPSCADPRNPQIQVPIPKLNLDDPLYSASGQSTGQRLSDVMQTSDIDLDPANSSIPRAIVEADIAITTSASLPSGTTAQVCVSGSTTPLAETTVTADALTQAANLPNTLYDSSDSAHLYYQTIDPNGARTTLTGWLSTNGFNPGVTGWAADAHAVYTNNYDLGLGRDMYMKFGTCDSGFSATPVSQFSSQTLSTTAAQSLQQLIGHCDVAAVVVNYAGVQAAAQNSNAIVAVAMEYSASPGTTTRFVKFYVFAPDTRTGAMQRVTSVDLDHRGQKSVPQSCVVCHGGTPASPGSLTATAYTSTAASQIPGDVNSGFIPWDLDSFWYSDTEPGFSSKPEDATLKAQYTRANQQDQLKLLNVGAYLTMSDPARFGVERELLEGWYGGAGMPKGFDGTFVPSGWLPANNGNPANSDTIYKDVFERNCRMCHALQAPKPSVNLSAQCSATSTVSNLGDSADQFPMSCYWQFANAPQTGLMLSSGRMPFARRTLDRLWVDPAGNPGGATASKDGAELIAQLNNQFAANSSPDTVVPPGTTNAVIPPFTHQAASPGPIQYDVQSFPPLGVAVDGFTYDGSLITQPTWQVCVDPGTGSCAGAAHPVPVVGANSIPATFQVPSTAGNYLLELDSGGTLVTTQSLTVPNNPPSINIAAALPSAGITRGSSFVLTAASISGSDVTSTLISGGNGPLAAFQWWVSGLTNLQAGGCTAAAPCAIGTTPSTTLTEIGSTATSASYTVNVTDVGGNTVSVPKAPFGVTSSLSLSAQVGFVAANSGAQAMTLVGPANLLTGITAAPGDSLSLQISCDNGTTWVTTSCTLGGGTLTLASPNVSYHPPLGLSTNPKGGGSTDLEGNALTPLSAMYRVTELDASSNPVDQAQAALSVQVRARVAFDTDVVVGVLQNASPPSTMQQCSSCHNPTSNPGLIRFDTPSPTYTVRDIYCSLVGCPTPTLPSQVSGSSFVALSDATVPAPPTSELLTWPAQLNSNTHSGGARCAGNFTGGPPMTAGASCDLLPVLKWIEDGAHDF